MRHPTFGLWHVSLENNLRDALQRGIRKIVIWTDSVGGLRFNLLMPPARAIHFLMSIRGKTWSLPNRRSNDEYSVFGVVGWKNSGKTTLTERLVSELTARGLTMSMVKHTHHNVDVDRSGTDSYRHRRAGAQEVMLAGGSRLALMHEYRSQPEFELDELLSRMAPDLVL